MLGFEEFLAIFSFKRHTEVVAAACLVLLFASLLGGMISSMLKAFGGPLKPRKFKETGGFRILLLFQLCLLAVLVYYHGALTGRIEGIQVVFWIATMAAMPVLWLIGSQMTYLVFWKKIEKNRKRYQDILKKQRAAKQEKARKMARADSASAQDAAASRQRKSDMAKRRGQPAARRT